MHSDTNIRPLEMATLKSHDFRTPYDKITVDNNLNTITYNNSRNEDITVQDITDNFNTSNYDNTSNKALPLFSIASSTTSPVASSIASSNISSNYTDMICNMSIMDMECDSNNINNTINMCIDSNNIYNTINMCIDMNIRIQSFF